MVDSINWVLGKIPSNYIQLDKFIFHKDGGFYSYNYKKNINFCFYCTNSFMTVQTTVSAVTGKNNISLTQSDMNDYLNKFEVIVCSILSNPSKYNEIPKMISRVDYKIDVLTSNELEKSMYLKFLTQLEDKHHYLKKNSDYVSSKYLTGKYTMRRYNLYSRIEKTHNKEDELIIRLEVQNLKRLLIANKKKYGITRDLINYWDISMWKSLLVDELQGYMLLGTHYKIEIAYKLIDDSEYTDSMKKRLKKFLNDTKKYDGLTKTRNHYDRVTYKKYIKLLQTLRYSSIGVTTKLSF